LKKTIVHIIQDLNRGGAETMLVSTVREYEEYNNVIVTLFEGNQFGDQVKADKMYCLGITNLLTLPFYAVKLRRIIKKHKADIVHSHLYWATFLARLATPASVPLVTTIHSYIASSVEYKKPVIRWIEKFTYRFHKTTMLAASQGALDEYFSYLKLKPYKAVCPYTFVDTRIFNTAAKNDYSPGRILKVVSVGRLTIQKNHKYFIEAFSLMKDLPVELDIYGMGECHEELQELVRSTGARINLKGQVPNINELLKEYDLFTMSSLYEGFSLAVLEAMAIGLPVLLSDIASFREQCADTAEYFDLNDPSSFKEKLTSMMNDPEKLKTMGEKGKARVLNNFTLDHHLKSMREIYKSVLQEN